MEFNQTILDKKRNSSDDEADQLVTEFLKSDKARYIYEIVATPPNVLKEFESDDLRINDFLHQKPVIPDWLDNEKLKRASDFYVSYALEIMMLLGAVSLPTCYAASPGNKVLYISEKIRKKPGKRLLETASFVITVSEPGAFDKHSIGYVAVQQVRLIHAIARYHILTSGKWDKCWGLPANEEDMLGTNLAFSYTVLKTLKDWGFNLNENDLNAYLHLWKWVGYLMKIDKSLLTDRMDKASQIDQIIRERNFKKTKEGIELTRSLITHYKEALPNGLGTLVESQIRYFVGQDVAEKLGLRSNTLQDLIVRSMAIFQEFKNHWMPHRPSYVKMKKDHVRLKEIYQNER